VVAFQTNKQSYKITHTTSIHNIHVYKVHGGSAFEQGASRSPHYCAPVAAPLVYVLNFSGGLAVCRL